MRKRDIQPGDNAACRLAAILKEEHEEGASQALQERASVTVWGDLLNAALSGVDWLEVAQNLLEE